jgi:hypothetical protein
MVHAALDEGIRQDGLKKRAGSIIKTITIAFIESTSLLSLLLVELGIVLLFRAGEWKNTPPSGQQRAIKKRAINRVIALCLDVPAERKVGGN